MCECECVCVCFASWACRLFVALLRGLDELLLDQLPPEQLPGRAIARVLRQ